MALVLQICVEGERWQLWPLYLVGLLLIYFVASRRFPSRRVSIVLVILSVLFLSSSVALSWLMPMFHLPSPTGPFAVGTRIVHLVDQSRTEGGGQSPSGQRELMVQVWYPAGDVPGGLKIKAKYQRRKEVTARASYRSVLETRSYMDAPVNAGGPYPVILYNPGWMGERTEGTFQMEELASHGFVVIAIDHTFYGGLVEFPDGRVADSRNAPSLGSFEHTSLEEEAALGSKYVRIEAGDDVSVLNQFATLNQDPQSPWFHRLDPQRVLAMGFSIGGAVAEQAAFIDSRIKGALNLDGWTFGDVAQLGLNKPLMVIYEDKRQALPTASQLRSGSTAQRLFWEFSAQDYAHISRSVNEYGGYILFVSGSNHVDFTDRSLFSPVSALTGGGVIGAARAHQIVNAYTLAFASNVLKDSKETLLCTIPSPYREVEINRIHPGKATLLADVIGC
jgi:dienelactone hydrolase